MQSCTSGREMEEWQEVRENKKYTDVEPGLEIIKGCSLVFEWEREKRGCLSVVSSEGQQLNGNFFGLR